MSATLDSPFACASLWCAVLCCAAPVQDVVAKAKDMHPKLSLGMFIFFALGAVGGMMSLVMQDRPIFERYEKQACMTYDQVDGTQHATSSS